MKITKNLFILSVPLISMLACNMEDDLTALDESSEFSQEGAESNQPILQDGEERFGEGVTPVADVHVADSRFLFLEVEVDGEMQGIGILDQVGPNTPDPSEDERLRDASPLDLYLAITPKEMAPPEELLVFEDHDLGPRGWFALEVAQSETSTPRAVCTNSSFQSSLRNWYSSINDGERWRLNTGVSDGSGWTGPTCGSTALGCATGTSPSYYSLNHSQFTYSIYNVDEMKQRVAICSMNPSRNPCSTVSGSCNTHLGPTVRFGFRTKNNASAGTAFTRDMTASDLNTAWRWRWHGSILNDRHNWDWKISLRDVKQGDSFDLGWIWEHRGW